MTEPVDSTKFESAVQRFDQAVRRLAESTNSRVDANKSTKKTADAADAATKSLTGFIAVSIKSAQEIEAFNQGIKNSADEIENLAKGTVELTYDQQKLKDELESQRKGYKRLGKEIALGTGSLSGLTSQFESIFSGSTTAWGKAVGGFATGASFMLTNMDAFAKDAGAIGGFADLNAFSVGSVRQAKIMSGLGESFNKVISDSQNGFRVMGKTSQDAVENLSQLSFAFRNGTSFMGVKLRSALGPEYTKMVNDTSNSLASMGATSEDIAMTLAATTNQVRLSGKTGDDATKAVAKGFHDTAKSARELSSTFGVSASKLLEAANKFNLGYGGKRQALVGGAGGDSVSQAIAASDMGIDDDKAQTIASLIAEGKGRQATGVEGLTPSQIKYVQSLVRSTESIKGRGEEITADGILKGQAVDAEDFKTYGKRMGQFSGDKDAGARLGTLGTNLLLTPAEKAANDKKITDQKESAFAATSEGKNIKSMTQLTSALDSLRNTILTLPLLLAGAFGLASPAIAGAIAGIFKSGAISKAIGALGNAGGWMGGAASKAGGWMGSANAAGGILDTAGKAAAGVKLPKIPPIIDKAAAASGKGMTGFVNFLKKLGSPQAMRGIASLALLGAAVGVAAFGFKQFNDVKWESVVAGSIAIGVLAAAAFGLSLIAVPVAIGAAVIAGLGVAVGIFGAGAMIGAAAANMLGNALAKIAVIDGSNLIAIGAGLAAIGAGMVVFSAGAIVGTASSVITGLMSLFGAKSPLDRIMEFVPYADKISLIGTGIKDFGNGVALVTASLTDFDTDKFSTLKDKLLDFAKAGASNEMRLTAEYLSQIGSSLSTISSITPTLPSTLPTMDSGSGSNDLSPAGNGLTAEGVGQMISYLSQMLSELESIKSNTRSNGFTPVRLS